MKSMRSGDRNLIFQYDRSDLIGPQTEGNQLILEFGATKQDWVKISRPVGRDANTFFRLRKTLQPTLRTRIIKDLEPLSRVIGSLPTTKKERQATAVVTAIEGILTSLKKFMSAPVVDDRGNPVLDPITNRPVIQVRTITEILDVAHAALQNVYQQNNVVLSPVFNAIIRSFTIEQSVRIMENVRDIEKLRPGMSQQERDRVYKNEIVHERLNTDDEISQNTKLERDTREAVLENKTNDGDWKSEFGDVWIRPERWRVMRTNPRVVSALKDFVTVVESRSGRRLTGVGGAPLNTLRTASYGVQFGAANDAFLNLETLEFVRRSEVPVAERAAPQPLL